MKRFLMFFGLLFALALLTINLRPTVSQASEIYTAPLPPGATLVGQKNRVVFPVGKGHYFLNDQTPGIQMDAVTFMENDRTYVPVRFLANALGIDDGHIKWDDAAQLVTLEADNLKVKLTVGKKGVDVNGQVTPTDVAPLLRNDRVYLPARFVAEALEFQVDWVNGTQMVLVYWPGDVPPNDNVVYEYYSVGNKPASTNPTDNKDLIDVPRDGGGGLDMTKPTEKPVPWSS
jgi:hypothetical protein